MIQSEITSNVDSINVSFGSCQGCVPDARPRANQLTSAFCSYRCGFGIEMACGMSLPTRRGDQRVKSWGRARKWNDTGRPPGRRGGTGNAESIIRVLLGNNSRGYIDVIVNGERIYSGGKGLSMQYFIGSLETK
jgi:hypothetical protein